MSDTFLSLLGKGELSKSNSSSNNGVSGVAVKTAPSLFDSLLSGLESKESQTNNSDDTNAKKLVDIDSKLQRTNTPKNSELTNETQSKVVDKLVEIVTNKVRENKDSMVKQSEIKQDIKEPENKIESKIVKSEIKPEIKSEIKPEIKQEIKEPENKIESKIVKAEIKPEIKSEIKPEIKQEIKEPETKIESKIVKPEIKPEIKQEIKEPENKIESKIVKAEIKPEIKQEIKEPETKIESKIVKAEIKPEIKQEIKEPENKIESKIVKTEIKPEVKPEIKQEIKEPENKIESKIVKAEIKPEIKQEIKEPENKIESKIVKAEIKPEIKPEIKQEIKEPENKIESKIVKAEIKPEVKPEIKQEIKEPENKIESKIVKTEIKPEIKESEDIDEARNLKFNNSKDITPLVNGGIEISEELAKYINEDNVEKVKNSKLSTDENISKDLKNPYLATSFLSSQNKLKELVSQQQIYDAKKNIEDNKTISSVKKSAQMLDLDPEKIEAELKDGDKKDIKIDNKDNNSNKFKNTSVLDRMVLDSKFVNNNTKIVEVSIDNVVDENKIVSQSVKKENINNIKSKEEVVINLNVPQDVTQSLESKIIGAQQKVGNFMSEVARNMYLNYKPPLTAFRMNLNPANLGNISIIMKSNKTDNTLSVSMNMSNSSTMESFVENRNSLQSALQRNLNDGSNISLDFGMQNNDNSSTNSGQFNQESRNQNGRGETVDNNIISEKQVEENVDSSENYM